jgi:uncharacterized membrane protein YdjX (TVP38/TMEM64 family)
LAATGRHGIFKPGSILTLGAGLALGVAKDSILASMAATLGATAAVFVGRYLARRWVSQKIDGHRTFNAIDLAPWIGMLTGTAM